MLDRPANGLGFRLHRNRPRARYDLGDQKLGGRRETGDPDSVVDPGGDETGNERPVPERVLARRAADEALRSEHLPCELGMSGVHTRIDHRDGYALEGRQCQPRLVEAALGEVPLLRGERVGGRECKPPRQERLDVPDPPDTSERTAGGKLDDECGDRSETLRARSGSPLDRPRNGRDIHASMEADGNSGRISVGRQRDPDGDDGDEQREAPHPATCNTGDIPAAKPPVAGIRAR